MTQSYPDYPLFIPPLHLAERTFREFTAKDAKEYAAWFHAMRHGRVRDLIRYAGLDERASRVELLAPAGEFFSRALPCDPFMEDGVLTSRGLAAGADMGLMMAEAFEETFPHMSWKIMKGGKRYIDYQQPVIVGLGVVEFNPIRMGIAQSGGVASGSTTGAAWREVFDIWSEIARKHAATLPTA